MDSITMPVLQVLLLAIMFLAILVEVKTGGTGTGIMFGLVAAVVFWGSQYAVSYTHLDVYKRQAHE